MPDGNEYKRRFLLFVKAIEIQNPEEFLEQDDETLEGVGRLIALHVQELLRREELIENLTAKIELDNLKENQLN